MNDMILILNYSDEFASEAAKRLRAEHIYCRIISGMSTAAQIREIAPRGILLTGEPQSASGVFDAEILGLGVPVLAVGVPTVVETSTLLQDVLEENGCESSKNPIKNDHTFVVTPKDIDAHINRMARLLGYGVSLGLHRNLRLEDVGCFVN